MHDGKVDKVEKAKRIRIVMEWLLEDWSSLDIINQITAKWTLSERHAKRYLAEAREKWNETEDELIDQKRKRAIEKLRKLKRSLKDEFKGTPQGIRAVLAVESKIFELEKLDPAKKYEITGANGEPIQTETKVQMDLSNLSDEELRTIVELQRKLGVSKA